MARETGFQIARDLQSDQLVHIKDIPEGYQQCVCAHCGDVVVASNRNQANRQKAIYFRHKGNQFCSPDTMLHSIAEDILLVEKELLYPVYEKNISIPKRTKDNKTYSRNLRIAGGRESYTSVSKEERYPNSQRIADVIGAHQSGLTYIEIRVHHEVDIPKQKEINGLGVDCIEIDMRELLSVDNLTIDLIKEFVVSKAPRKWISANRYKEEFKFVIDQLNKERSKDRTAITKKAAYRKEVKDDLREIYSDEIEHLHKYMIVENQEKLRAIQHDRLHREGTIENKACAKILDTFPGGVPEFLNIPLKGELAFKYHRIYWQYRIYQYLQYHEREYVSWVAFTPQSIYEAISGFILLTNLSQRFENTHGPLVSEKRGEDIKYLAVNEYEALPKPIPTIRRYLNALVERGIITKCSGDSYERIKGALISDNSAFY